ncbi:MAG: MoxR family ATPase [Chloroflexi bacterium]|nr:MoxR family ATPase [Chloroflexota bacterium]
MNIERVAERSQRVVVEVEKAIIGKRHLLKQIMAAVLAEGHILLEDYPGLGKTLLANSFATALGLAFKRIQFTPDLLPGDITGGYIFNRASSAFELRTGPLFANIVLADEINRASPKTQSALLEAMQEYQVTLEGETMALPRPFLVLATQNPIEYEGTFPLPEAQLDRFLMKLSVGYPTLDEEQEILRRRRERQQDEVSLKTISNGTELSEMRASLEQVHIDPDIEKYMVALAAATRKDSRIAVGASPRASLAFMKMARAWAVLNGRSFVLPDDVKQFILPVLAHRIILKPDLWMKRNGAVEVIQKVTDSVPVPVTKE